MAITGFSSCGGCGRHVRAGDSACPFCGAAIREAARLIQQGPGQRLSRAAIFAGAVVVGGCSTATPEPAYGGPIPEPEDGGTVQVDGGGELEDGGAQPVYGAPVHLDGGAEDGGNMVVEPAYGAPIHDDDAG